MFDMDKEYPVSDDKEASCFYCTHFGDGRSAAVRAENIEPRVTTDKYSCCESEPVCLPSCGFFSCSAGRDTCQHWCVFLLCARLQHVQLELSFVWMGVNLEARLQQTTTLILRP